MRERSMGERKHIGLIVTLTLLVLLGFGAVVLAQYHVKTVVVEGNEHYSDEEIMEMVLPGGIRNNSILLSVRYRNKKIEDIPFVETVDVDILSKNEICIRVYEKVLAGCVSYLGSYLYFDREGIVVETSQELTDGVPQIDGLTFDHVVMHEKIPVQEEDIFSEILKVTQLLAKYELKADHIYFNENGNTTLMFDQARIYLGTDAYIDEKIEQLSYILPSLESKAGTLHLENYDENTTKISFEPNR